MRNCLLNTRRGQDRQEALAVRIRDTAPPSNWERLEADRVAQWLDLVTAWRALNAGEQEVLALAVFEDLTSAQAAQVIGVTPVAYRLRLMRARRALHHHLDPAALSHASDHAIQESTS